MLRSCVLDFKGNWRKFLPYAEFAYNNSYQASIGMDLNEALYGRRCRTPLLWEDSGPHKMTRADMQIQNEAVIQQCKRRLQAAQARQQEWANKHRSDLQFQVGQEVLLKISPIKGVSRVGNKRKLRPRYVGPFTIMKKIGEVAYKLALPPEMSRIHDVFHVSQLKKFYRDSDDKPNPPVVPISEVNLETDLTFPAEPIKY